MVTIFKILRVCACVYMLSYFGHVQLCDPMDCRPQGSSAHGDSPDKNTGVSCHALLQGIFSTQETNPYLMSPALAGGLFTICATWEAKDIT